MTQVNMTELLEIDGGQECYNAGISLFGLEISISIGRCPLASN